MSRAMLREQSRATLRPQARLLNILRASSQELEEFPVTPPKAPPKQRLPAVVDGPW